MSTIFDRLKLKMIPCLICVKVKVTMQKLALMVLCTLLLDYMCPSPQGVIETFLFWGGGVVSEKKLQIYQG